MNRPTPVDKEIKLTSDRYIVSKTDPKGIITYTNDYFIEICQYNKEELIGKSHNIIRHPDMPKVIFKLMWNTIKEGENFRALIKNLAKDGSYYWVLTDFETLYDPTNHKIVSYTAYRMAPSRKAIEAVEPIYKSLVELEQNKGLDASEEYLTDFLKKKNKTYDEFIESLTSEEERMTSSIFGKVKGLFSK